MTAVNLKRHHISMLSSHNIAAFASLDREIAALYAEKIGVAEDQERTCARSAPSAPVLSLDYRTYDAHSPSPSGEWYVQHTHVDDYGEFLAVEDEEGTFTKGRRSKEEGATVAKQQSVSNPLDDFERNETACRRAKRNLKWKVLMLRGDRIWTLTTRGGIPTFDEAWKLWGQFERHCWRRFKGFRFDYVVVVERHKSGAFHIHFVTNRFFDANILRLLWHRILTRDQSLTATLKGAESPGNVDVSKVLISRKLCFYLSKYLGKTFDRLYSKRVKRFASSKGIPEPSRSRTRMHARMGEHVYRLRCLAESEGWKVESIFEGAIAGRRLVWLQCKRMRRPPGGT